jgi:hypothetical protein
MAPSCCIGSTPWSGQEAIEPVNLVGGIALDEKVQSKTTMPFDKSEGGISVSCAPLFNFRSPITRSKGVTDIDAVGSRRLL